MKEKITAQIRQSISAKEALLGAPLEAIEKTAKALITCIQKGNKILFFGNGGSAADSQHLAAEFVGRYETERRALPAIALTTDTSILTAVGNDYGFERIFERQIEALGKPGDVAVGISTSGHSKNVLLGLQKAKALGLTTVGFLGRSGGEIKSAVDIALVIPAQKTSRIQECHILIGHILCELVDEAVH
jgi:D-sedoheptulose 7-phosphate isomerase